MSRSLMVRMLVPALLIGAPAYEGRGAGQLERLGTIAIRHKLTDKSISYSPPGWADAGISETFRSDGSWSATIYSVAVSTVPGKWTIRHNKLCVSPDPEAPQVKIFPKLRCRVVWRGASDKEIMIEHVYLMMSFSGPLVASITKLTALR